MLPCTTRGHAALGVWQAFYDSPWHHPAIAWVAVVLGAIALASRQRFLFGYLVVFGLEIAADALASAPFIHVSGNAGSALAVLFVILGDLRFFLVVERCASPAGLTRGAFGRALGLSLVVPVVSFLIRVLSPLVANTGRLQFLAYEVPLVLLVLALRFVVLPRRLAARDAETRRWAYDLATFVAVQYALWILADVLLLADVAPAYALRVLPNIMYYALFLPFVYARAPRHEGSNEREPRDP